MSTINDYTISPEQVKSCKADLDKAISDGLSQRRIDYYQWLYNDAVEKWKETFPNFEIPT